LVFCANDAADFDRAAACALGIRMRNEGGNRDEIELQICGGRSGPPQLLLPSFPVDWGCYPKEARVIKSRNADVEAVAVSAVEGKPMYGGDMLVKPLIKGDEMTFLEIHYAAGVGAPLHTHTHESIAYVVKGKVKSTVGSEEFIMGSGDVCRHPKGVLHGLEAIEDSVVVEIKSPAPEIGAFFAMRK
jgi:unsaturated pyranuronate lyase